ncbi:N-acetylneuraminate synthase family protein [Hymenobacter humi]
MTEITIGGRPVGPAHKPFIIAEMSGNHNQSLERALALVDAAAAAGVDALKLQTYTADTITMDTGFAIDEEGQSLWEGKNLYKLYEEAHTPWEWHAELFARARQHGMLAFSSPFDETAVDFLEQLDVPAYKIASFENAHWPLLRKVAATGKPVIVSTGAATLAEIDDAVRVLREAGCREPGAAKMHQHLPRLAGQHQPAHHSGAGRDLRLPHRPERPHHGRGRERGRRSVGCLRHRKALHPEPRRGRRRLCLFAGAARVENAGGRNRTGASGLGHGAALHPGRRRKSRLYKRSIYVARPIAAGEEFTTENLKIIRPGDGLWPRNWEIVLGRKATRDLKPGTPLTWEAL